ncbi:unnamed protein product [Mytilus edulis]|uniref:C2H2-type domain-containing protein n=1 Tax=Mytilus edulis TaxID=6550 RepID=A0A8S3R7H1_MYTED|nr:unnamed protein product [Mytilus edulis]
MDDKTCPVCKLQFSRKDVMMRHHRNKHGITEPYPQSSHEDPPPPQQREGTSPPPPPAAAAAEGRNITSAAAAKGDLQLPRNEDMPPPPRDEDTPPPRKEETEHFVFKHPFTMTQQSAKTKKVIPTSNDIRTVQHSPVPYSYEDGPGEQTYEKMPSCDDCGVVLDSMHDLQRHIKHWCPENEYLKRKRDNEDLGNESPSKKSTSEWIKYDSVSDDGSEDVNMDDNEGYKSLLHEAIDTAKDTWDTKYDKYVKEGMNEEDAIQRSNEKISHIVQRQFFKRYTKLLKLIVPLR